MTTKYMRTGKHEQFLHLVGCPRYGFLAKATGRIKPWHWANNQSRDVLFRMVAALDIKVCRTCQPFGVRAVRSPR